MADIGLLPLARVAWEVAEAALALGWAYGVDWSNHITGRLILTDPDYVWPKG
jgi:hypothetical protein